VFPADTLVTPWHAAHGRRTLKYASVGQVSRAYQTAIEVVPGVADQTGAGGNPSVFGANLGQNSYQVDGLNTTDPVTHTFSLNFGFDAIQEIAIQTGGFEAEYGRAVGGIINVITKSGGNRFSGTADARYTTSSPSRDRGSATFRPARPRRSSPTTRTSVTTGP
jgi:outer membrane receptor for Fe3+-dicitrate